MKSTQSCIPAKRKDKRLPFLFMLGGLLLMFPVLLPATALAAPRSADATPLLTQPQQIVDLAGVSVVRLSLGYLPAKGTTSLFCTTLGTIIASWPAQNPSDKNNWVLTDGSLLLASKKNTCAPNGTLASITLYASSGFTNNQPTSAPLGLLTCTAPSVCHDMLNGTTVIETILTPVNNAVLFSFHTANPLPYVDVEKANTTGLPPPTSIELANSNHGIPRAAKNVDATTLEQFLTPIANATVPGSAPATPGTVSTQSTEPGMPSIDGDGKITGMQLSTTASPTTTADIEEMEKQLVFPLGQSLSQLLSSNTLSQRWDAGMIDYEQGNNTGAVQALGSIQNAPPAFQAPAAFIKKAQAKLPTIQGTPGTTSTNGQSNHRAFSFLATPILIIGLIAAIVALVLLFVIVSIRFGRRRIERREALINSNIEKQPNASVRVILQAQLGRLNNFSKKLKQAQQIRTTNSKSSNLQKQQRTPANSNILCPNCGQTVRSGAAFCPNCRYSLPLNTQNARHLVNTSPPAGQPIFAAPSPQNSVQPQQTPQAPKMQDDLAIEATLQRLWDKAGR